MDQEKIGNFIKKLRQENNLTQAELAKKYGVTYQAVSKWENGKNLPDMSLIKQMSEDFNINIEDFLNGEVKERKKKKNIIGVLILILVLLIVSTVLILINKDNSFEFKTISSNNDQFRISGSLAYNKNKSAIYISNIKFLGEESDTEYKSIECSLYENDGNTDVKISSCSYDKEKAIKLDEFLKDVTFSVDNYQKICKDYSKNSLYLQINAVGLDAKTITYKIPLNLESGCLG